MADWTSISHWTAAQKLKDDFALGVAPKRTFTSAKARAQKVPMIGQKWEGTMQPYQQNESLPTGLEGRLWRES